MPGIINPAGSSQGALFGAALIGGEFYTVYEGEPLFLRHFPSLEEAPSVDTQDVYGNFMTPTYISNGVPYIPFIPKFCPWYGELLGLLGTYTWQNTPIVQVKSGKWTFDPAHASKWYELEANLQCVAQALLGGVPFRPKGFRPFGLPHRIGYMEQHPSERVARHAVLKSRDGFLPLIAQISLFIFLRKVVANFDTEDWRAKVQNEAHVTAAWWDQLEQSAAGDMNITRIGGILDLRLHGGEPSEKSYFDEIFAAVISFSLPMPLYIRWGQIIGDPQIRFPSLLSSMGLIPDLAEQTYLRTIPGPVKFSPWSSSITKHDSPGTGHVSPWVAFYDRVKEMTFRSRRKEKPLSALLAAPELRPELESEPARPPVKPFPPVEKNSGQRAGETMASFLARRKSARERAMARENVQQRQRRQQHEENASAGAVPGKRGARIYIWELRDGHYIRTPAGLDKYEEIWERHSESQRIYDWNTNEWDVCEAFGTNEDKEDLRPHMAIDFDPDDEPLIMGPDRMEREMSLGLSTSITSLAPVLPTADLDLDLPPSSTPTETAEQLAELRFGCYFPDAPVVVSGLSLPTNRVPAKVLGDRDIALPSQGKLQSYLTFLAQCRDFKTAQDLNSILLDFHNPGSALNQNWEVDVQRISCIADGASFKGGLRYVIRETDNPDAICLVLESATTVLEVIRRNWGPTVDQPEVHTDLCVCRHAYTEHCLGRTPDTQNPNYSRIKGGNIPRKCGAFIAPIRPTWQQHTSCVACHEPWYYHDNVEDVPTFPSTASSLPQPLVLNSLPAPPVIHSVPDSSPRHHTGPVLPPPANLFRHTLPTPPAVEFHNPAPMGATRF
ncbi:hypothetical protein MSAN_02331300 [Mycena sanguinolenta]|uniref:Uncharacterized protein n=1 Tax=Mycena sanguinolenta TaxID=230812 RepID=A0A8H7CHQ0_9AGAR|nr:hypothetical protein MSAN_02331300 [Mycena sanguinolenta]